MRLEDALLTELKALRSGTGLSEARLRDQGSVRQHLAAEPLKYSVKRLVELVESISDQEQKVAVRYALGIEGADGSRLTKDRRITAMQRLHISERTLIRRELDGLSDLARVIIEQSPVLNDDQREEEMNSTATVEDQISNLEKLVSILARKAYASDEPDGSYKEWMQQKLAEENEDFYNLTDRLDVKLGGEGLLPPVPDEGTPPTP